jgi:CheY-like chemotaxis protein
LETDLKLHVLIVDDNQVNRLLLNKVLKKWGVSTDFAENGLQAVQKVTDNHNYDLVLMDIYMPDMGGIEATTIIRKMDGPYFKELPVIALTASMLSAEKVHIEEAGINDYILKPYNPKDLYDKLSSYQKVS